MQYTINPSCDDKIDMGKVLDLAEQLWNGDTDTYLNHPFAEPYEVEKISEGLWFNKGFSNTIIRETSEGLIIIDPAAQFDEAVRFKKVRSVTKQKVHSIIFTHGHVDHGFGVKMYHRECKKKEWKKPQIISHVNVPKRFDRYKETHGYNEFINHKQFLGGQGQPYFPIEFIYPTKTFEDFFNLRVGEITVNLYHGKGETDDAIWAFFPEDEVLCTGDLFIWGVPNGGNPQKAQRYVKEWAETLTKMAEMSPKILLPGHGVPIIGKKRVQEALMSTTSYLASIHSQTIQLMNEGLPLREIISEIQVPEELIKKPYLQPIYDEPEFIVRNIWRLYGGWYDGEPANLKPAPELEIANEITLISGGSERLSERALNLMDIGKLKLATHLISWALKSDPENEKVRKAYVKIFATRAKSETSTMAMAIYLSAIRKIGEDPGEELAGNTPIFVQKNVAEMKRKED